MKTKSKALGEHWEATLARMESMVNAALETIEDRSNTLEAFIEGGTSGNDCKYGQTVGLEKYSEHLQSIHAQTAKAQAGITELDDTLAAGEEELRRWLESTKEARETLQVWLDQG